MIQINRQQIQYQNNGQLMLVPIVESPILMGLLNVGTKAVPSGFAIIEVMMVLLHILFFI